MADPEHQTRFFLTTAIDYPNNRPHIGTAFEKIGADAQARYRRMQGYAVHFLMGNDENTIKVSQRAAELGVDPKTYVDDMARQFQDVWRTLEISNDDFIQTSDPRHHAGCQKFIQAVFDAGFIYKKSYSGLYCDGCEAFKTEKELISIEKLATQAGFEHKHLSQTPPERLFACPNHTKTPLRHVEEENYFFRLSEFAPRLLDHFDKNPAFLQPESRRNEILALIHQGLQDVSITRKGFTWGIPVPFDPDQTIYVWFDALLNYITAIGYGWDEYRFRNLWPADVHVIGKDITRFHCALWPAMLMAAGLELPRHVFAHGFVYRRDESTGEIQKISKSLGNVVEPMDLVRAVSAEAFRYYFLRQCPFGGDGEFSFERFAESYNADLANNLGNLYSRTITMASKYFQGDLAGTDLADTPRQAWLMGLDLPRFVAELKDLIESFQYNLALQRVWLEILDSANRYIQATLPYKLINSNPEATRQVLAALADALRVLAIFIKPFLPKTAQTFYHAFNFEDRRPWASVRIEDALALPEGPSLRITAPLHEGKPAPLFPKFESRSSP
jgi:methionyl-tRNA synthetase